MNAKTRIRKKSTQSARSARSAQSARSAVCSLHGLRFGVTLAKENGMSIVRARKILQKDLGYTLHKPRRRKFPTLPVVVFGIDEQWTTDLIKVINIAKYNQGYRYLLTVEHLCEVVFLAVLFCLTLFLEGPSKLGSFLAASWIKDL